MNADTRSAVDEPGMVIVGAGLAGVQVAEGLRAGGCTGTITLFGDEAQPPYHRPPLSKAWLAGEADAAQLVMRSPEALAKKQIDFRAGAPVVAIDRDLKRVHLADGSSLAYAGLALATGATPRRLSIPGADAAGVVALRGRSDADEIKAGLADCLARGLPLVVIGGGFIGLEVAATARKKGVSVTVLEAMPGLLGRVLTPQLSDWFAHLHRSQGVELVLGSQVGAIEAAADGRVGAVRCADGSRHPAGLVVVGIGVVANDGLARAAGLECERGVVVDACGRTADPSIVAAGDCTARRQGDGSLLRLESVNNATEQGKCAAAALLGQARPFAGVPWFWSDQYDRKLQMAGLASGADQSVLRGDMSAAGFAIYHFRAGKLIAVDTVNASREHLQARKLIETDAALTPDQAADTSFDLAALLVVRK
jgi:3-phenylpropionate/trans-cinnamate dioxygenase ferredoxin reductase subunit